MTAHREGQDDDPGREVADLRHDEPPGLVGVLQVRIGEAGVPPLRDAQDGGGALGLLGADGGAPPGAGLPRGEIEDPGPVAGIHRLEQGAGAGELHVVAVGGDGQDVDGHGWERKRGKAKSERRRGRPRHSSCAPFACSPSLFACYAGRLVSRRPATTAPHPSTSTGTRYPSEAIPPASTPTKFCQASRTAWARGFLPGVGDTSGGGSCIATDSVLSWDAGLEIAQPALHPLDLLPHPRELALDRQHVLQLAGPGGQQLQQPLLQAPRVGRAGGQVHELLAHVLRADVQELEPAQRPEPVGQVVEAAGGNLDLDRGLAHLVPAGLHVRVADEPADPGGGHPEQIQRRLQRIDLDAGLPGPDDEPAGGVGRGVAPERGDRGALLHLGIVGRRGLGLGGAGRRIGARLQGRAPVRATGRADGGL